MVEEHSVSSFFDMISAIRFGAGEPSDGFDLNGLIQALASIHFGVQGIWTLDMGEILKDLHSLRVDWTDWAASCGSRVWSWFTSLHEVFGFHNREISPSSGMLFLAKYSVAALADLGEDFLKYQSNYLACRLFRQEEFPVRPPSLPVTEKSGVIFHDHHRWFFHRLRSTRERLQFGYSLIQFKRGCQPVSSVKRIKALAKHAKALGREPKDAKQLRPWIKEVQRTVREILGERSESSQDSVLPPSTSAHYNLTRANYGALPRLQDLADARCVNHTELTFSLYDCPCHRWDLVEVPKPPVDSGDVSLVSLYTAFYGSYSKPTDELAVVCGTVGPKPPLDLKSKVIWDGFVASETREDVCDVHLVLEPFKVRTITAGSAVFGWLGRYWQKKIHSIVGKHPAFEYTHAPVSFSSIRATFGRIPTSHVIVSGDYEAATDNLEMELTKAAWTECASWLESDPAEAELVALVGNSMLSGQKLNYGKALSGLLGVKSLSELPQGQMEDLAERFGIVLEQEQRQGQLMGCILSFFLLCMINLAIVRCCFERYYKRRLSCGEIPVKINGDDILFHGPEELVEDWKVCTSICGLKPSIGKNFVSKEFGMINSEMYQFKESSIKLFDDGIYGMDYDSMPEGTLEIRKKDGDHLQYYYFLPAALEPIRYIPYVNLGLLTGSGRVQSDTRVDKKFLYGDDKTESAGARARTLVKGFSHTKGKYLIDRFIELNREILSSTKRGWGIPESLGGLGIPYVDNHSVPSRVVAAFLDSLTPGEYQAELRAISGVTLAPPPHVVEALRIQKVMLDTHGVKRWGDEAERKNSELPLLVGATWVGCDLSGKESRKISDPERSYERLVRRAINSGVKAMSEYRIANLRDRCVVIDINPMVRSVMEGWIPTINHRLTNPSKGGASLAVVKCNC